MLALFPTIISLFNIVDTYSEGTHSLTADICKFLLMQNPFVALGAVTQNFEDLGLGMVSSRLAYSVYDHVPVPALIYLVGAVLFLSLTQVSSASAGGTATEVAPSPRRSRREDLSGSGLRKSSMLELQQLRKVYGPLVAVEGTDLRLEAGDVFGFIGPNGAGKTTTIKMLATADPADERQGVHQWHRFDQASFGSAAADRLYAGLLRPVRRHQSLGVLRLFRRRLPHAPRQRPADHRQTSWI